ncbi:MAK10-like protein [Tanacetum coccineum]|uniref:MAK10-like protein n=1 Tax=Tanacetum coccineum TaxID=301880 RepID=A0ABQ5AM68_9ASTR
MEDENLIRTLGPSPQAHALETTFKARLRDYMAVHTERMERFKNAIFKQREGINSRMTEIFGLLKELTTSRTPKKVLIREEAKFPVTKNVNSISLTKGEEEKSNKKSHSYIYPLGIAEDMLVKVAKHVYPIDFMILDIKENEKRPFILGTLFLTTTKAIIRFDKGTITLRSGKSKANLRMGRKDKAPPGKGDEVQPMEEQKFEGFYAAICIGINLWNQVIFDEEKLGSSYEDSLDDSRRMI